MENDSASDQLHHRQRHLWFAFRGDTHGGQYEPTGHACSCALDVRNHLAVAEVASQFSEAGNLYLYARTAFGRFIGLQVGWFWLLAIVGGGAANANLFLTHLAHFMPSATHGWVRVATLFILVAIPALANYIGVREGANLSGTFTIAKTFPLLLVIGLGLFRPVMAHHNSAQALPSVSNAWPKLLLQLFYAFSGWEDALVPSGEVQEPRRTIPFALGTGMLICAVVYTLFQLVYLSDDRDDFN